MEAERGKRMKFGYEDLVLDPMAGGGVVPDVCVLFLNENANLLIL